MWGPALGYFHNTSYYELGGGDFDAAVRARRPRAAGAAAYVETVRSTRSATRPRCRWPARWSWPATTYTGVRPQPVAACASDWKRTRLAPAEGIDVFHAYAFGTVRQCGADAELAADFAEWLGRHDGAQRPSRRPPSTSGPGRRMKSLEFLVARAAGDDRSTSGALRRAGVLLGVGDDDLDGRYGH